MLSVFADSLDLHRVQVSQSARRALAIDPAAKGFCRTLTNVDAQDHEMRMYVMQKWITAFAIVGLLLG